MNFYMGESFEKIDYDRGDVEFEDELLDFIYKMSKREHYNMSALCNINPYGDTVISQGDLPQIISICNRILENDLLERYKDYEGGMKAVRNLHEMSKSALGSGKGLVVLGD